MAERMSKVFKELQPDLLIVLGDRYELLPMYAKLTDKQIDFICEKLKNAL